MLQNTAQINQMLSDLNRVDFANVQVSAGRGRRLWGWGGHSAATKPKTSARCALGAGLVGVPL